MAQTGYNSYLVKLETVLNEYFAKKAPALPQGIKEFIVKIAPYFTILSVILSVPAVLVLLGLGGLSATVAPSTGVNWLSMLLLVPIIILEVMAIPGLFSRQTKAWKYLYWAQLIGIASALIQLNIVGAIINAVIGFYILFQIRSFYK